MSKSERDKKRIRVNASKDLAEQSSKAFNEPGMKLSGAKTSSENLADAVSKLPVKELKDKKAVEEWILEDSLPGDEKDPFYSTSNQAELSRRLNSINNKQTLHTHQIVDDED